jgi:hypothetical protein
MCFSTSNNNLWARSIPRILLWPTGGVIKRTVFLLFHTVDSTFPLKVKKLRCNTHISEDRMTNCRQRTCLLWLAIQRNALHEEATTTQQFRQSLYRERFLPAESKRKWNFRQHFSRVLRLGAKMTFYSTKHYGCLLIRSLKRRKNAQRHSLTFLNQQCHIPPIGTERYNENACRGSGQVRAYQQELCDALTLVQKFKLERDANSIQLDDAALFSAQFQELHVA